jgi:predicted dehydrogenase
LPARLRVGIVGCGNVGALHLPAWLARSDVADVVALADPTKSLLERARAAAQLSPAQVHADPAELIARDDIDAVDVCTPQHLHRDLVLAAAAAGKHVLCEKPLATVPADAAAAIAAAEEAGVTFGVVHNFLWLPEVRAARRVIESGELGELRLAIVDFLGVVDVPGTAAYSAHWRHDVARSGGGVLMDMLHGVYLAEALLGEPLLRASAYVGSRDPDVSVEDIALCRYETARAAALVNIAWGYGPGGIHVCGARGRLEVRYAHGGTAPWAFLEHVLVSTADGTRIELHGDGDHGPGLAPSLYESFEHVVADFAAAVRDGRLPAAPAAAGLRALEATVAAYESAARGEVVTLPLDRHDPAFREGALGLRRLELPEWSPLHGRSLYAVTA